MAGQMDGRMDGPMNDRRAEWTNGGQDLRINKRMDECFVHLNDYLVYDNN